MSASFDPVVVLFEETKANCTLNHFPFHCEMKWIGDGVCDDETNQFECGYDYGDCCLNEIVDTSCYKCICHIDGKNHQITTNTQIPQLLYTSLEEPKNGKKLQ